MATRTETLNSSPPAGLRILREAAAKLVSALAIVHESFVEGQELARAAEKRHRFIAE